jgi:hypothetical protein
MEQGVDSGGIKKVTAANVISSPPASLISLKSHADRVEKIRCQGRVVRPQFSRGRLQIDRAKNRHQSRSEASCFAN